MAYLAWSLGCSFVLLMVVFVTLRGRSGALGVCVVSVFGAIVSMCLLAPAVALQALLTFAVAGLGAAFGTSRRTVFAGALAAMVGGHLILLGWQLARVREIEQLRHDYPIVSLSDRLAYEQRTDRDAKPSQPPGVLAAPVELRLGDFEQRNAMSWRARVLRWLHEQTTADFVLAPDFGVSRMPRVSRRAIELPDPGRIPLPTFDDSYSPEAPVAEPPTARRYTPLTEDHLLAMHEAGVWDLLSPDRMGYVRDRDHVTGFTSHGFSIVPPLGSSSCNGTRTEPWQLVRLELIGMLRHETPVAYVSQDLPRMDALDEAPTRPLNDFEAAALEQLRYEQDVVTRMGAQRIAMVGSLRAGSDCLECHTARRGELLGALSYELRPQAGWPTPQPPQRQDPQANLSRPGHVAQSR